MESINVAFLDFDGVVNTPMWYDNNGKLRIRYNFPKHGKVNNWQACQWLSKFCKERGYSIVVSSTWRKEGLTTCRTCLYGGGIWDSVPIIGATPVLGDNIDRGFEIQKWLDNHAESGARVKRWVIIDDYDGTISVEQGNRLVLCRSDAGFLQDEYNEAVRIHLVNK